MATGLSPHFPVSEMVIPPLDLGLAIPQRRIDLFSARRVSTIGCSCPRWGREKARAASFLDRALGRRCWNSVAADSDLNYPAADLAFLAHSVPVFAAAP